MSNQLTSLLPNFTANVASVLRSAGLDAIAAQIEKSALEKSTFDQSVNAGYLYLVQSSPFVKGERLSTKTVGHVEPHWFNVDVRPSGEVFGIELLSPTPEFEALSHSRL